MELLNMILLKYNKSIESCSYRLEFEESSNTLAALQGELAGGKLFLETFRENFSSSLAYDRWNFTCQKLPDLAKISDAHIVVLETQRLALLFNDDWIRFQELLDKFLITKKEWLFYQAEKGRDLVFTHAWRDGIEQHKVFLNEVEHEYSYRQEENTLFRNTLDIGLEKPTVDLEDPNIFDLDEDNKVKIIEVDFGDNEQVPADEDGIEPEVDGEEGDKNDK